jgi:hypothetical protein
MVLCASHAVDKLRQHAHTGQSLWPHPHYLTHEHKANGDRGEWAECKCSRENKQKSADAFGYVRSDLIAVLEIHTLRTEIAP